MKENTLNNVPYELILSDLEGSLSADEKQQLHLWRSSSKENEEIYYQISSLDRDFELLAAYRKLDTESSWNDFKPLLDAQKHDVGQQGKEEKKIVPIGFTRALAIAASVLLLVWSAIYYNSDNKIDVFTASHQQKKVTLPDGTEILLNEYSQITYNQKTYNQDRTVNFIKGEGFFNVAHDNKRPFKIKISGIEIRDIGTSFNVCKEKNAVSVVVSSGLVSLLNNANGESVLLTANHKAVYDLTSNKITSGVNNEINYKSWADRHFQFIGASLPDIAKKLEQVYGIPIIVDGSLKSKILTISFNNQPIDSILSIIGQTMHVKIEKKNGIVYLKEESF